MGRLSEGRGSQNTCLINKLPSRGKDGQLSGFADIRDILKLFILNWFGVFFYPTFIRKEI